MKIGIITKPNEKGQFVIPKSIREKFDIDKSSTLNILVRDSGFFVYPVNRVLPTIKTENSYLEILKKTRGAWSNNNNNCEKIDKKRKKIELAASNKRKKPW